MRTPPGAGIGLGALAARAGPPDGDAGPARRPSAVATRTVAFRLLLGLLLLVRLVLLTAGEDRTWVSPSPCAAWTWLSPAAA
ncbi:hypothetical protein SFUMM280S_02935 [Streptomyces fumanus]